MATLFRDSTYQIFSQCIVWPRSLVEEIWCPVGVNPNHVVMKKTFLTALLEENNVLLCYSCHSLSSIWLPTSKLLFVCFIVCLTVSNNCDNTACTWREKCSCNLRIMIEGIHTLAKPSVIHSTNVVNVSPVNTVCWGCLNI